MNMLSLLIKPASSLCNMRCKYCFYYDVADHRDTQSYGIMDEETTDILIEQAFKYTKKPGIINFAFQGGEPTVAGIKYFKYFTDKVNEMNKDDYQINYSIQTNGQLIDEEFCELLHKYNFLVGISQDGPKQMHDVNRVNSKLKGTYDQTNKAIKLMDKYKVEYNILSVITKQMAKKPQTLFRYYTKRNFKYVQLIPCLNPLDDSPETIKKYELTPHEYAEFLIDFFNLWYEALQNNHYISVRLFDNLVFMLQGKPPEQCGMLGQCSLQCVVESDGSIYPCDFYVLDEFKLGNIHEEPLTRILTQETGKAFLGYEVPKNSLCENCKVYSICMGGCKRYRSFYSKEENYCPYQDFLYHVFDKLQDVARSVN
jgi:uncharacterized protein